MADLRFAYTRGAEELFDGLTHRFTPGAVTALTGPSGRGKSTLLYVLGLMLTPSAGVVRLGDVDASALPDRRRARLRATSVGFVFQDAELDPSRPILDSVVEPGLRARDGTGSCWSGSASGTGPSTGRARSQAGRPSAWRSAGHS